MTTHGITRLRRSLDNQRSAGAESHELAMEDMEILVRECENERDALKAERDEWCAACAELQCEVNELSAQLAEAMLGRVPPAECPPDSNGEPIFVGDTVYGQDGKCFKVTATGPSHVFGRAGASKNDKRLRPEWLTHERPDSWEAVERDARTIDACCTDLMSAADLVARCKRLAGVE